MLLNVRKTTVAAAALCLLSPVWAASAEQPTQSDFSPEANTSENLALGRPYTFNCRPSWDRDLIPGYFTWLTDGKYSKLTWFGDPGGGVSFRGVVDVQIVIDLGKTRPIGEVFTRHDSWPPTSSYQPAREVYYVSDDGEEFFEVGRMANPWDPRQVTDATTVNDYKKGIQKWTSGPIRAKGRYVMVRTFPALLRGRTKVQVSLGSPRAGFDEIVVKRGQFDVATARVDKSRPFVPQTPELPADVLGYRLSAIPSREILAYGPLYLAPTPYAFLREPEFHLSLGGVFLLDFYPYKTTTEPIDDVVMELTLPASVTMLSKAPTLLDERKEPVTRDGVACVRYTWKVDDAAINPQRHRRRGWSAAFLLSCNHGAPGKIGRLYYQSTCRVGRKAFSVAEEHLDLLLEKPIQVTPPKEFVVGPWHTRLTTPWPDKDKWQLELLKFYRQCGFNALWGSGGDEDTYARCRETGLVRYRNFGTSYVYNGFQFTVNRNILKEHPDWAYVNHPSLAKITAQFAICPEVLASEEFYPLILKQARAGLKMSDNLYANWEPNAFRKRGCACDRCKAAFTKFSGMTPQEVDKLWPDIIRDTDSHVHNLFTGRQVARVLAAAQRAITQASNELGRTYEAQFVPAISDRSFDRDTLYWETEGAREFCESLDGLAIWGMPYDTNLGTVNLPRGVGNSLVMAEAIDNTLRAADQFGRREGDRRRPRVYNVSGIQFSGAGRLAMPRDFYMTAMLNFICGVDGHGSYREYGMDARYLRLWAKAAHAMATYEGLTLHGEKVETFEAKVVSPVPAIPAREVLLARSWQRGADRIIALGNDYYYPFYVELKTADAPAGKPCWLVDRINGKVFGGADGYTAEQLKAGVLIDVPGKEFRILEVRRSDPTLKGLPMAGQEDVQQELDRQLPALKEKARYIESLIQEQTPETPLPHRPLPASVLKIQGLE